MNSVYAMSGIAIVITSSPVIGTRTVKSAMLGSV